MSSVQISQLFHPAVAAWFAKTFPAGATPVQMAAWPAIRAGQHTLIAAPTGSGKTLSAFLAVIDNLVRRATRGGLQDQTYVVYVSPLKALSNDIQKNLAEPLAGIAAELAARGLSASALRTAVRTGDTAASDRQKILKNPPHILVTTPESLYLLLTSQGGRRLLGNVETVIVDEIHALAANKRGAHLALSLERLAALIGKQPVRIGLSATQKPLERVAHFLTGVDIYGRSRPCTIVDSGHRRQLDLAIEVPNSPLSAVMEAEVWTEIYERLCALIGEHTTTLIFVNTRRLAERLSLQLQERLGADKVAAHHGSMSKEKRFDAEQRLKQGQLKCLVATASLELGIDIGAVDLVVQIGSPKSIAVMLQRVGRASHHVGGVSKGRIFPLSRDELVECAAMLDAIRRGELDSLIVPEQPIDILAQQMVAEVASREWDEAELLQMVRGAYPYRDFSERQFAAVIQMLAEGYALRRGRRAAYIHYDAINRRLRPRRGARLTALTCGGAIPDTFEYDVVLDSSDIKVGSLDEDFALEAMAGDIFQLGNNAWRIVKVDSGKVRVADAAGQAPTIPFWLGEGPGRSAELSQAVARLRREVVERIGKSDVSALEVADAVAWLVNDVGVHPVAAEQIALYLGTSALALGAIPTQDTLVVERFFDEAGDMHVVLHSPFGSRMNRAWGLALRKRFCRTFNFELQAAANEDAIILSLGLTHSFPVADIFEFLSAKTARDVLVQAMLDAPMFAIRWRWNASRSLAILRSRAGKRMPPQLQRMDAEDLLALVFPDQLACLENIAGDREIPDHPLVQQTIHDCLTEAMDIAALEALLQKKENGQLTLIAKDLREPSPLAQEIINAKPYAFLDDTPLEERRTNAIKNRRWLDPAEAAQLATLDWGAIERVQCEAWPSELRDADEMHDALMLAGFMSCAEVEARGQPEWPAWLAELAATGRAQQLPIGPAGIWIASERALQFAAVFQKQVDTSSLFLPERLWREPWRAETALVEIIRSRLDTLGPITASMLAAPLGLAPLLVEAALFALESQGYVFQGQFMPGVAERQWCERRLLARIHKYTVQRLRAEIEPVAPADFMRFLLEWQRLSGDDRSQGPEAVVVVAEQLQGFEAAAVAWEADILPARVQPYDPAWLDQACLSGRLVWGRFSVVGSGEGRTPIRSTPLALAERSTAIDWQVLAQADAPPQALSANAQLVWLALGQRGALFFADLARSTGLLHTQLEAAIAELVAAGLVTADSFMGLRALLTPQALRPTLGGANIRRRQRQAPHGLAEAGRWSPLRDQAALAASDISAAQERFAWVLLKRYGVVFRKLLVRERLAPPWRDLVMIYRRLEARGAIRGGHFVSGVSGEQFALPDTLAKLRAVRRQPRCHQLISISAADPLNLVGIITSHERVTALAGNRIVFCDGEPIAVLEAGQVRVLRQIPALNYWDVQQALRRRPIPPQLRAYLGNNP